VILASRELGVSSGDARKLAEVVAAEYADEVQKYATLDTDAPKEAFWTAKTKTSGKLKSFLEKVGSESAGDARKEMLDKYTVKSGGKRTFQTNNPDLRAPSSAERARVIAAIAKYKSTVESSLPNKYPSFFTVNDVAIRLFAGTGSLGKMRYYVLVQGESSSDADDDVILDVKQQGEWPTGLLFATAAERSAHRAAFANEGQRVMIAYKALSSDVDDTLGYVDIALDSGGYLCILCSSTIAVQIDIRLCRSQDKHLRLDSNVQRMGKDSCYSTLSCRFSISIGTLRCSQFPSSIRQIDFKWKYGFICE
jgi:uncharacterized protein (DUF2252 family)